MAYDVDALIGLGERVMDRALSAGADVAEVSVSEGAHLTAKVRLGEPEVVEEAGSRAVSLRVMRGKRVAVTSTSDLSDAGLSRFVADAIELAGLSQEDPFAGPADPALLSTRAQHRELDLFDDAVDDIDAAQALEMARRAEKAAFDHDGRVGNSDGATVSRQSGASALITSGGFRGGQRGTYVSLSVNPVVDDEGGVKRSGYYWSARRHADALEAPEAVGIEAARRTLDKLGSRKLPTQQAPVIFDPDAGRAIVGLLAGCVTGGAIWRKSSYLVDRLGDQVGSELVGIVDDPLIARAPGSRPFDGEGLLSRRNVVVEKGELKSYLLDSYSARKLDSESTASASRGGGRVGAGTTNFFLQAGELSVEALLADTPRALYVTDMMGFGFNAVTGDFSRGASGFWIENGQRAFPVSEVTISLNLDDLLKRIDAVASDLDHRTAVCAPTFRVSAMTIAGT